MVKRGNTVSTDAIQRRALILEHVRAHGSLSIMQLAENMQVSAMTIRRDLDLLHEQGLLQRTYGGAVPVPSHAQKSDPPFFKRAQVAQAAKRAIAQYAATLVQPNERLILDSGSTVAALCLELAKKHDLTIISYSLPARDVAYHASTQLVLTGGLFDPSIDAVVGPLAEGVLAEVRVDKVFLGATSVHLEDGFSNSHLSLIALQRTALRVARERYLLVDSSKFQQPSFWLVQPLDVLTAIITDDQIEPSVVERFAAAGVRVLVAS